MPSVPQALIALTRLLRALAYYPPEHPEPVRAASEAEAVFRRCLDGGRPLSLQVRRQGFAVAGAPVGAGSPPLLALAQTLAQRRVAAIEFHPALAAGQLLALAQLLGLDPAETHRRGGLAALLSSAGIDAISLRETRLPAGADPAAAAAFAPAPPPPPMPPPTPALRELKTLLELLCAAPPDEFVRLLPELEQAAAGPLHSMPVRAGLALFPLLLHQARRHELTAAQRQAVEQTLARLATAERLEALIGAIGDRKLDAPRQKAVTMLLVHFFEPALAGLLRRWASTDAAGRECLLHIFTARRRLALERLRPLLDGEEERLPATIALLGQLRDEAAVPQVGELLAHPAAEVRRESLCALGRIGGEAAGELLLARLAAPDRETRLLAIASLGQLRLPAALPALLRLTQKFDPFGRRVEEQRAAAVALGRLGGDEAAHGLLRLLRRRWFAAARPEVRAAAAAALAPLRHPGIEPALERARSDRSTSVRRAATLALQLRTDRHGRTQD